MKKWAIVPVMGVLWVVGLAYNSGIGIAYDIYGKTKMLTIGLFLFLVLFRGWFQSISYEVMTALIVLTVGGMVTYVRYGETVEDYLWVYLLIPLIACLPVEAAQMRLVALLYGALGGVVLFLANYAAVFQGWNSNSVAMIAFFSYMVFIGSFSEVRTKPVIFVLLVYSLLYFSWLDVLNARSSMLFSVAAFLCVVSVIPLGGMLRGQWGVSWILWAPLLLAVAVVLVRDAPLVTALNVWSLEHFDKPIFNGREKIWARAFRAWCEAPVFGHGDLSGNFHNSALTCLFGGGIAGFALWLLGAREILRRGLSHLEDGVVYGLMIGVLMIWLQQSVELGLVAPQANVIPYGMLGLLLGRVNTLEKQDGHKTIDSCSGL